MGQVRAQLGTLHRAWIRHPRWSVALNGAVAAAIAWVVGVLAPAPLSDYPYYAPLGALIAATGTVARSVRSSVQAVGALLLGVVIARATDLLLAPGALSVAVVVGVALLCAGWHRFGDMGSWVATSAIFVLIIGDTQTADYVGAYCGLVVVGAAIGIATNLVLPPLPITPSELALDRLRDALADQLESLADDLAAMGGSALAEHERRSSALRPAVDRARAEVTEADEATRANPRARRYRSRTATRRRRTDQLEVSAEVVDDIVRMLLEPTEPGHAPVLGPRLGPVFAGALRAYAASLRADDAGAIGATASRGFADAVDEARRAVLAAWGTSERDDLVAAALVVALRRGADALAVPPGD
jgi:uncharacterized membrane protein YgaE (UPF0421/DUF939 family)